MSDRIIIRSGSAMHDMAMESDMPAVHVPAVNLQPLLKITALMMLVVVLAAGLSACGKRGDPYRPAEVSTPTS